MTSRLEPYDPRRDRPDVTALLARRFARFPAHGSRTLAARYCLSVPDAGVEGRSGLVLRDGGAPAFAFMSARGPRCRVHTLLCDPPRVAPLVAALGAWLRAHHAAVLVEAESWWDALGLDPFEAADAWTRCGFGAMGIDVLEAVLPATRGSTVPAGYVARPWRERDLDSAGQLMAANPDPLGRAYPLDADECRTLLAASDERGAGATLWCGSALAGFLRAAHPADVAQLYVADAHRDRGAAGHLLDVALSRFFLAGARRARLAMATGNDAARHVYASRGFAPRERYAVRLFPAAP